MCPDSLFWHFPTVGRIVRSHKAAESSICIVFVRVGPQSLQADSWKFWLNRKWTFSFVVCSVMSGRFREQFNTHMTPSLLYSMELTEGGIKRETQQPILRAKLSSERVWSLKRPQPYSWIFQQDNDWTHARTDIGILSICRSKPLCLAVSKFLFSARLLIL